MGMTIIQFETYVTKELPNQIRKAASDSVKQIGDEIKKGAIKDYKAKRKKQGGPSLIIESFNYKLVSATETDFQSLVFCGGPNSPAYYAEWVDEGHTLRNKSWWDGYMFMWEGYRIGDEKAAQITISNLNKNIR